MNLKTYQGNSMADALAKVKANLGRDAVILHTRTFRRGGLLGVVARRIVEITASQSVPPDIADKQNSDTSRPDQSRDKGAVLTAAQRPLPYDRPPEISARSPQNAAIGLSQGMDSFRSGGHRSRLAAHQDISTFASGLRDEMNEIRVMVRELLNRPAHANRPAAADETLPDAPAELQAYYTRLLQNEVAEEVAREVMAKAQERLAECRERIRAGVGDRIEGTQLDQCVQEKLQTLIPAVLMECIERMLPGPGPVEIDTQGTPKVVALVGPTGVGKTTTIAKLAAHFKLRENKNVAMITIDTYRIAAVDQLRAYADIMSLPVEVVYTPDELVEAIGRLRDYDLILLDTSGRSHRDTRRLDELNTFLDAARSAAEGVACEARVQSDATDDSAQDGIDSQSATHQDAAPMEVHLLLSCTCHPDQLLDVADKFSKLGVDRAVFTKLDEAVGLGVVLNVASKLNLRLSYLTTGQDVPDDIEVGHRRRIAERLLNGDVAEPPTSRVPEDPRSLVDHFA